MNARSIDHSCGYGYGWYTIILFARLWSIEYRDGILEYVYIYIYNNIRHKGERWNVVRFACGCGAVARSRNADGREWRQMSTGSEWWSINFGPHLISEEDSPSGMIYTYIYIYNLQRLNIHTTTLDEKEPRNARTRTHSHTTPIIHGFPNKQKTWSNSG